MMVNAKPGEREEVKRIMQNLRKNACNNYRRFHGMPMRRWVQMRKVVGKTLAKLQRIDPDEWYKEANKYYL